MLSSLQSPAVCVIDDEPDDYQPLLGALNSSFIGAVHLDGDIAHLPAAPFAHLQLVFVDLHLSGTTGKTAASYTAKYFHSTVSIDTAPLVVVIWSKYADDIPAGEPDCEAEIFKKTLLDAYPAYIGRVIFVEMEKPTKDTRPADWQAALKEEIEKALQGNQSVSVLWSWNQLVRDGSNRVGQELTFTAQAALEAPHSLQDGLRVTMQRLAAAQSEGSVTAENAPKYLLSTLSQLLADQLEHPDKVAALAPHGDWISRNEPRPIGAGFSGKMNGLILTADHHPNTASYGPGTVYRINDRSSFESAFGRSVDELLSAWETKSDNQAAKQAWKDIAQPILIELSPACDLAQNHRVSALFVAGVIGPSSENKRINKGGDAFGKLSGTFYLRWPHEGFAAQDVCLGFCNRFKMTVPATRAAPWLTPWFKLRELPTASIRNSNAAHAARVGYASLS